jgi:hypothetical protein
LSKWNKIEHRLFSHITLNWRGRPLTTHEVVVNTIAAIRTSGGLCVEATRETDDYPTGVAVSKERLQALPVERPATHGAWNYSLYPRSGADSTGPAPVGEAGRGVNMLVERRTFGDPLTRQPLDCRGAQSSLAAE